MAERKLRSPRIRRLSVVDQVSDSIKQSLLDQVWKEGDKLPSEGELAEYFGVNRLSVRMALQKLSTLGLIETRVGEGSFVAHFSVKPIFSELAPLYDNEEGRRDVEQLRNLLEGECTNIAIISATEEERQKLKERLDEYNRVSDIYYQDIENQQKLHDVVNADFAFHYEIICMSHNKLYMDIYMLVQQLISSHIRHLVYTRTLRRRAAGLKLGDIESTEASHEAIYQSIINGNVEEARNAREQILGIIPAHGLDYFEDYVDPSKIHP